MFIIKPNRNCFAFCKVSGFLYLKNVSQFFLLVVYINVHVVFADDSHCDLHSHTFFFVKCFYIHKKNINPIYVRIYFKALILRALLSNKKWNLALLEKVNNSVATKLCAKLLNDRLKN